MNEMILQLASLAHQLTKDASGTAVKSKEGGTGFLSVIKKSMNPHVRKPVHRAELDAQTELIGKDGRFYIESLRKAFLAKGGSLQNVFLSTKDLPLIGKLLRQCGFSDEAIERFLTELLKDNPGRQVSLSEFFDKVAELSFPDRELERVIHLESGAIPYIEAALRNCGLTPKQLDAALSAAREESGDLNLKTLAHAIKDLRSKARGDGTNQVNKLRLDRFVRELEDAISRTGSRKGQALGDQITVGRDFVQRMSHKLGNLESSSHPGGAGNTMSLEHLSSHVERAAGEPRQGNQLPADISKTIEHIVESVGAAKKEDGPTPIVPPFSKVKVVDLHSGRSNTKGKHSNNTLSALEGRGTVKAIHKNAQPLSHSGSNGVSNGFESGHALESRPQEGNPEFRLEAGIKEGHPNAFGPSFSEAASGVSENQRPATRGFLPGYLVEQVGRQIARSLLGGQRIVRLQLRPPELGTVKVEMDINEHVLKLGMVTENSSVKELLLSNAHELKEALVQQGIKLDRLDVQVNYDSNQSLAHSKEDPGEEQKWIRDGEGFIVPAHDTDEDLLTGPGMLSLSHHVLDLII